jgi:glycosyltransferase involved in cell wall biosynthesis
MANILYIAQFFSLDNEPGGQGQRHYRHAQALANDGHTVTVLTGDVNSMDAKRSSGAAIEQHLKPGLRVIRLATGPMNRKGWLSGIKRHLEFGVRALWTGVRLKLEERRPFAYVLGSSPPLPVGIAACILSVLNRADFYLDVLDLQSQTIRTRGPIQNSLLIGLSRMVESWLHRRARKIIAVSPGFIEQIEMQTPFVHHKIELIPNGADIELYQYPQLCRESFMRATPEDQALFQVNYAGSFNDAANLETILAVAAVMQDIKPNIRFNLAGGGDQFEKLKAMIENYELWNVKFWEPIPRNKISKFIMEGDLSIIHYRALPSLKHGLPNKLFDYMAAGRPIMAAVPEGEISRMLKKAKCGITVQPDEIKAMVDVICWFHDHPDQGLKMGVQGYNYVCRHFDNKLLTEQLLKLFPRVISMHTPKQHEEASTTDIRIANIQ